MIEIQKELLEMIKFKKYLTDDILDMYLEYSSMYSQSCWLEFFEEKLRRNELEITIL